MAYVGKQSSPERAPAKISSSQRIGLYFLCAVHAYADAKAPDVRTATAGRAPRSACIRPQPSAAAAVGARCPPLRPVARTAATGATLDSCTTASPFSITVHSANHGDVAFASARAQVCARNRALLSFRKFQRRAA
eukprot:IDg16980t1